MEADGARLQRCAAGGASVRERVVAFIDSDLYARVVCIDVYIYGYEGMRVCDCG